MEWLDQVRTTQSKLNKNPLWEPEVIRLDLGEDSYMRSPYEEIRLDIGQTTQQYRIEVNANKKIVWCCMCYGRAMAVKPHIERILCLGIDLNSLLAKELKNIGVSFSCVLFVTEEALDEQAFKALAHVWSIKVVELPEVHPTEPQKMRSSSARASFARTRMP